ncbi:MAG: hypothetical protein OXC02_04980 [Rhodobacteraceae bacterium]|nr:hypothetical protein [Paracoccaceae bacterium]
MFEVSPSGLTSEYYSLLNFDQITRDPKAKPTVIHNPQTIYKVNKAPSDTAMRE